MAPRSSAPTQRQLRVAEVIRHAIAEALMRRELPEPILETHVVTVPEVRLSPDLKIATVFVMPLGGKDGPAVIKALARQAGPLRSLVARRIATKFVPSLRFRLDETFDYAGEVDQLLRRPEVRRDLAAPLPDIDETDE